MRPERKSPDAGRDGWLTTTVRPAGAVDDAALARMSEALGVLEPGSDIVVIDLTAADVLDPRKLARHLRARPQVLPGGPVPASGRRVPRVAG